MITRRWECRTAKLLSTILQTTIVAVALSSACLAHAHGPVAQQASTAIARATDLFLKEPADVVGSFRSVSAKVIGDERFAVEIMLNGKQSKLSYVCGLMAIGSNQKWGCKKDL